MTSVNDRSATSSGNPVLLSNSAAGGQGAIGTPSALKAGAPLTDRPTSSSGIVRLPRSFFRKERDVYADYRTAFVRELLQNSIDAGASVIDIRLERVEEEDGTISTRVIVADDGCGMDMKAVEVFMTMGETTKSDSSTIGGFGRARIVTCWSNLRYAIRSQTLFVSGEGANFQVAQTDDYHKGCTFIIDVHPDDMSLDVITESFAKVLAASQVGPQIIMQGTVLDGSGFLKRGRYLKDLLDELGKPFARIYVNKSAVKSRGLDEGELIVRSSGCWMFSRRISALARVVVELEPDRAREVLTASRDNLRPAFSEPLGDFLALLEKETLSGLDDRSRSTQFLHYAQGNRYSRAITDQDAEDDPEAPMPALRSRYRSSDGSVERNRDAVSDAPSSISTNSTTKRVFVGPSDLPDILVLRDPPSSEALKRGFSAWANPSGWGLARMQKNGIKGPNSQRLRFLLRWATACDAAVQALIRSQSYSDSIVWAIGLCLAENSLGMHIDSNDVHYLMVNPLDRNGKTAFRLTSRADMITLLATAKHEAAHILCTYHDETYANVLTDLDSRLDDAAVIARMMRI